MTYRDPASWGPQGPAPAGPVHADGPAQTGSYPYGGSPYGPPPGPGQYPPPPPEQYPRPGTNSLATLSVVFAFVFAPVGALLGHLALGQIRRTFQRGRDRAIVGLILSYTVIAIAVCALAITLITASKSPTPSVTATAPEPGQPAWAPPTPAPAPTDLSKILLSLDEVKDIMKTPGLTELTPSSGGGSGGDAGGDATGDPPECAGVVAPGIDTVYDDSGAAGFKRASFGDSSTATMVEQVAAAFDSPTAARRFVTENDEQWRKCAGKTFSIVSSNGTSLVWDIGSPVRTGDRLSTRNTLKVRDGIPQFRIMAARGNVVIDLGVFSKDATAEPDTIADHMLDKVPG